MSNQKKYQAEIFYGYQECEDGIYHAFELTDPDTRKDEDDMAEKLADLLDTEPSDDRFDYDSMYVALPESLVERIKAEAIMEYQEKHGKGDVGGGACDHPIPRLKEEAI